MEELNAMNGDATGGAAATNDHAGIASINENVHEIVPAERAARVAAARADEVVVPVADDDAEASLSGEDKRQADEFRARVFENNDRPCEGGDGDEWDWILDQDDGAAAADTHAEESASSEEERQADEFRARVFGNNDPPFEGGDIWKWILARDDGASADTQEYKAAALEGGKAIDGPAVADTAVGYLTEGMQSLDVKDDTCMPKILLPLSRSVISQCLPGHQSTPDTSFSFESNDPDEVQWIGMTPIKWVETLAAATEEREAVCGYGRGPICVDDTPLSPKVRALPQSARRALNYDSCPTLEVSQDAPPPLLPPWDPSYLLRNDILALEFVEDIQSLAQSLEAMPHYHLVQGSYQRVRDHVTSSANSIYDTYQGQELSMDAANDRHILLRQLYSETIQKMRALVQMTESLGPVEEDGIGHLSMLATELDFQQFMDQYLRENWINPYPDKETLQLMASVWDTTTSVISNWLANARTRKWRPAIVAAYELDRPSNLLWADSLNIFDGLPVTEIGGEDQAVTEIGGKDQAVSDTGEEEDVSDIASEQEDVPTDVETPLSKRAKYI